MNSKQCRISSVLLIVLMLLTLLVVIVKMEVAYSHYTSNEYQILVDATLESTAGIVFVSDELGDDYGVAYDALNIMNGESVYAYAYRDDGYCSIRTINRSSLGSHADNVPVSQLSMNDHEYELLTGGTLTRFEYFWNIARLSREDILNRKYSGELERDLWDDWHRVIVLIVINFIYWGVSLIKQSFRKVLTPIVIIADLIIAFLIVAGVYLR